MKKQFLMLISIFAIVFLFCGAVSATSYSISNNGKVIYVKNSYGTSTLKDQIGVSKKTGTYGYGYYGVIKTTGKDIKCNSISKTAIYFNKNGNPFYGRYLRSLDSKTSNSDGSWSNSLRVYSTYQASQTVYGRTFNGLTFSGKGTATFYYVNGNKIGKVGTLNLKFYKNSTLYANVSTVSVPFYKYINGSYQIIKEVTTTKTFYTNGDIRKSTITSLYSRNSKGVQTGLKTYGTALGIENINGKKVTYTGQINIGTKYDPKDNWNEKFVTGDYLETRTSTAPNLKRTLPLESL